MEVEYAFTPDDVIAFQRYHLDHQPMAGRHVRWGLLLGVSACFLIFALVFWLPDLLRGRWSALSSGTLCGSLFLLYFCLFRHRLIARSVRLMLKEGQNAKILCNQQLTITPETLSQTTEFSSAVTQWAAIEKIAVTKDHAFFYLNTRMAYILPQGAFANEWEFKEFVETARRYHEEAIRSKAGS